MNQGVEKGHGRNLRSFPFSTFPQPILQRVDNAVEATLEHEDEQCAETCEEAIHRERRQRVRLEVAHQELDREPRGGSRTERTDKCLAADAVAVMADELGQLEQGSGTDDRRREQKRIARRVLVREPDEEPATDRDAGTADPGEEGGRLRGSDPDRFPEAESRESLLGL